MNLGLSSKMCKCQNVSDDLTQQYKIRYTLEPSYMYDVCFDTYFDWLVECEHKYMDDYYASHKHILKSDHAYINKLSYERVRYKAVDLNSIIGQPIFPGSITIVSGESGTGKTTFLLQALNEHAFYRKVGYVSGEQNIGFLNQICERCNVIDVDVGNITDVDEICELMSDYKMLVVDSFPCLQYSVDKYGKMSKLAAEQFILNKLAQSAQKTKCALFIILHSTKASQYKGSTFFKHTVDNMITLKKQSNGYVAIDLEKSRAAKPSTIYVKMCETGFEGIQTYIDLDKTLRFPLVRYFNDYTVINSWTGNKQFNLLFDKAYAIQAMLTNDKTSSIYKLAKKSLQYYYKKHPNEQKDIKIKSQL